MKSVMCFLTIVVSLFAFAQLPAVPDVSGLVSGRKAPAFPVAVLQPAPFESRGIRIGDEIKEAERTFLSWKLPSLSSKPGLCGSDGINRIETCTDVLDTGEYVNMTMLDQKVAQIYVNCRSGLESCDHSKLTGPEAIALVGAERQRNFSDCRDGRETCDHSKLTRLEAGALAIAEHTRNYTACLEGHGHCDRSQLTPFEAGAIPPERHAIPR